MSSYKFNSRGNAEAIRLMFAQVGFEYEDICFGYTSKHWVEFKPNTPYGVLPVLQEDGKIIAGSQPEAISRYLWRL